MSDCFSSNMLIRAVIFDLDGTLLDTLADLAVAGNQALTGNGLLPQPTDDYRLLIGSGARNLMRQAAAAACGLPPEQIADDLTEQLLKDFNQAYNQNWDDQTKPYFGILELLNSLQLAGIKMAVLSNKPDHFTQKIVSRYFPAGIFSQVAGKLDNWPIKPDPSLALEICRLLGVSPDQTAMIGDSGSDMMTACRAGMVPIGVLWGFRSADELNAGGAKWLAENPLQLKMVLSGGETR